MNKSENQGHPDDGSDENNVVWSRPTKELYFLIAHYLKGGPLDAVSQNIQKELEANPDILPQRHDWKGNLHRRSYDEMVRGHPHILGSHLEGLLKRLMCPDPVSPKDVTTSGSLLGRIQPKLPGGPGSSGSMPALLRLRQARQGRALCRSNRLPLSVAQEFRELVRCNGHKYPTYCVIFDRTGRRMITGSDDYLIKIWCTQTGRLINTFRGHQNVITEISLNSENTLLASSSTDGTVRVWDLQSAEPKAVLPVNLNSSKRNVAGVRFSPAAIPQIRYLASMCDDGNCRLYRWDRESMSFDNDPIVIDGRLGIRDAITCFTFNTTGSCFAFSTKTGYVCIYSTIQPPDTWDMSVLVSHVRTAWRRDGGNGLAAPQWQSERWGAPKLIHRFYAHDASISTLSYNHDGTALLTGAEDGTVKIWRFNSSIKQWKCMHMDIKEPISSVRAPVQERQRGQQTQDGSPTDLAAPTVDMQELSIGDSALPSAATGDNGPGAGPSTDRPIIERVETNMVVWTCDDFRVLASNNLGTIFAFDANTGRLLWKNRVHELCEVYVLAAHPTDPRLAFSGGYDNKVAMLSTESGQILREFKLREQVFDGAFSDDGLMFAVAGDTGAAQLFGLSNSITDYEMARKMPEQVFPSDYMATVLDANLNVIDEYTQISPHLMPHGPLMDFDGREYSIPADPTFGMDIEYGVDPGIFATEELNSITALCDELSSD
ncbi:hypothetical protein EV182_003841, partial [Spiromyces aspiralis]